MNLEQLERMVSQMESEKLEFKKSTGELKAGIETLCGFLNGQGGKVLFGVTDAGKILGQDIADKTLREVAQQISRLEPPAPITQTRVAVSESQEVLLLETTIKDSAPYTYRGRPYRRIGTTTSIMPQAEYERTCQ